MRAPPPRSALVLVLALAAGCGADGSKSAPTDSAAGADGADGSDGSDGGDSLTAFARCSYTNTFSQAPECKDYTGSGWTEDSARSDCDAPVPGAQPGTLELGLACDRTDILGECFVAADTPEATVLVFPGTDPADCESVSIGCGFASGDFVPAEICDGTSGGGGTSGGDVFQPFAQVCVDPVAGEPAGAGPDGQVCTWEAISGATEEGRAYADYASCEPVLSQRPYYPIAISAGTADDDPRLSDPAFMAELDWVTAQVESAACVCCHSEQLAPDGPSLFFLEDGPIWTDGLSPNGAAMMAGWIDSTAFGAFPPEDNNGFDRETTGVPTTDIPRMQAFWTGELARRGYAEADFADAAPFGGPLYDQLVYTPTACDAGTGIAADGTITWPGGGARYVYVLEEGSANPGVPPNLDLPAGTIWRLDVEWTADPVESGLRYGEAPAGAWTAWPVEGEAPALEAGETYLLYVLRDIYQPLARCLFTAP